MTESEEELKSLLMRVKEENEKAGLKFNIQKTKIMVSDPITSQQIEGGKIVSGDRFYFLGLQNHCRQWLQPWNLRILAPWKKSYDKPSQCIKKWRYNCKYTKSHRKRETASRGSEPWVFIGFDVSSGKRWGMDQPLKQGLSASFTALLEEFAESSPVWSLWSITVFLYSGKIHAPLINMEFC